MNPLFIGTIGIPELLIIAFIIMLLFGGKKLPQLMKGMGEGIKGLKDGIRSGDDED
jgi:sec-independent protein translocase protein TatA